MESLFFFYGFWVLLILFLCFFALGKYCLDGWEECFHEYEKLEKKYKILQKKHNELSKIIKEYIRDEQGY